MYNNEGGRKTLFVWIAALIVIIFLVNSRSAKKNNIIRSARTITSNITLPFKYAGKAVFNGVTTKVYDFIRIKGIQKENEALKAELGSYKAKMVLSERAEAENEKLRAALIFRAKNYYLRLLPAEIISRSGNSWFEFIEVDKGSNDKISLDTAVINEEGLVGRVCEVSKNSSKVLLVTDPTSAISVIDTETGDMGIASGNSMGPIKIRYMSATANVKIGDKIVTSGMSDIFPKGIIVGKVRSIEKKDYDIFQKVELHPAVSFSKLDKVYIIAK